MNRMRSLTTCAAALFLSLTIAGAAEKKTAGKKAEEVADTADAPVVKVIATCQKYDLLRPWQKDPPFTREGIGIALKGNRVLVAAQLVADQNFIEFEHVRTAEKSPAKLVTVDYEANLALLEPADPKFLGKLNPVELDGDPKVGDLLNAWQLESNGALIPSDFRLVTAEVGVYPDDRTALLLYRLTGNLQFKEGSYTLPLVKDGKLAAVMMRYNTQSQSMDAISTPVIRRFLEGAALPEYPGLPRAGLSYSSTRDPQFRRYLGLASNSGGVYISEIDPWGSAANSDLKPGDILQAIDGTKVDQDGNYADPVYGRISIAQLVAAMHKAGDVLTLDVVREGKPVQVKLTLRRPNPKEMVSPPQLPEAAPRYYIVGGLVFTELNRDYLREWGNGWEKRAPLKLAYLDRFQTNIYPEGKRRIVFLNQVLPTSATIGYERLSHIILTGVNGVDIKSLEDLDTALKQPLNGFHVFSFDGDPHEIAMDAAEVDGLKDKLKTLFGLPELSHL